MSGKILFKAAENKKGVIVPFDEIFKRDIGYLNLFDIHRKRTYCNIIGDIERYGNEIYSRDGTNELPVAFLSVKYLIEKHDYADTKAFIADMYEKVFTKRIVALINQLVEDNYNLKLDEKEIDQFNPGLQFKNQHAKILLAVSMGMKLIIPLVGDFSSKYTIPNEELSDYISLCFDPLFKIFSPGVDILNKLYQSVQSRVVRTKYSDNTFWCAKRWFEKRISSVFYLA